MARRACLALVAFALLAVAPSGVAADILPRQADIFDLGYTSCGEGWYDAQGQGSPNDYCRWVGNCGCRGSCSWWSCALAGSTEPYTPQGMCVEGGICSIPRGNTSSADNHTSTPAPTPVPTNATDPMMPWPMPMPMPLPRPMPMSEAHIEVYCGEGNAAISNAIGQSFTPDLTGFADRISVWIRPNLNYITSYVLEVYSGEFGALLATSPQLDVNPLEPSASALGVAPGEKKFYDFFFPEGALPMAAGSQYSWKLVRKSQHSGGFARCDNLIVGSGFWLGTSPEPNHDYSFQLYISAKSPAPGADYSYAVDYIDIDPVGCFADCNGRAFATLVGGVSIAQCAELAYWAGESTFGAQYPQGFGDDKIECWYGDLSVLGKTPFEMVDESECQPEPWTALFNSKSLQSFGGGCRNMVYTIHPRASFDIAYGGCYKDCDGRGFRSAIVDVTITQCAAFAKSAGHSNFGFQFPEGYTNGRAQCWYDDAGVNGSSPFERVPDSECVPPTESGERVIFNGKDMEYKGAACRNAVYNIIA